MKKTNAIRIMCAVIAMLMLLCTFVACADNNDDNPADTTPADGGSTTTPAEGGEVTEPKDTLVEDGIPADLKFNNTTVTVLYWEDQEHEEFFVEEQTGDIVADGIWGRNGMVEDRLGINLEFTPQLGNADYVASWTNYIQTSVQAGGGEFDVIGGYSLSQASAASKGLLYDLMDPGCEWLDFSMPWWPERLIDEATINDKLYFASGDISANALYMMYTVFVNNDIIEDMSLPNVYELVDNNEWTYDKFFEMCTGVYIDQDGDGTKSVGDRYGYMTSYLHCDPWFYGTGALIVDKDNEGNLKLSDSFGGERTISSLEKITNFLYNTQDGVYFDPVEHQDEFNNGNLLFMCDRSRVSIREFDSEDLHFSVVPFPKYDAQQENFVTVMGNPFTLYAIPIDSKEDELPMLSAFLEVYASESYRQVTPALFETSLKIKYSQDNDASRMYDIIRESLCFDLGRIFSSALIGQATWRLAVENNTNTWAATAKQMKKPVAAKLKSLIAAYDD